MIIQTLLLDNSQQELRIIQDKLDEIVENQNRMISELKNICQKAEQIEKNNELQIEKTAKMEDNQQLQTQYFDMVKANTFASAYFSAASCYEVMNLR